MSAAFSQQQESSTQAISGSESDGSGWAQHLAEELRAADSQREAELQRQAHYMTAAAAETAVAERIRHSAALDQVPRLAS